MSIVSTLKKHAESIGLRFLYADQDKANVIADQWETITFPCLIVLPIKVTDTIGTSGAITSELDFTGWFLDKSQLDATIDYDHAQIETQIIEPMREKARKFFRLVNHDEDFINPETDGVVSIDYQPAYGVMDVHTFGVFAQCKIPVIDQISVCD